MYIEIQRRTDSRTERQRGRQTDRQTDRQTGNEMDEIKKESKISKREDEETQIIVINIIDEDKTTVEIDAILIRFFILL